MLSNFASKCNVRFVAQLDLVVEASTMCTVLELEIPGSIPQPVDFLNFFVCIKLSTKLSLKTFPIAACSTLLYYG